MISRRIFFLHNPKAGGSSIRKLFQDQFSADAIAPVFSNAPNDHRDNEASIGQHRGFDFYAGHYGHDVFGLLGAGHHLITNFRDPLSRIISIYRYWRSNISAVDLDELERFGVMHPRDAGVVRYAHKLDFKDFIRSSDPDLMLYISNFHFRQLHRSPWEAYAIRPWHVWTVKRRISRMAWFYVAEMPMISRHLLGRVFPDLPSNEIPNENISQGHGIALSSSDIEHLIRLNRYDYEIYRHALGEQFARLGRLLI